MRNLSNKLSRIYFFYTNITLHYVIYKYSFRYYPRFSVTAVGLGKYYPWVQRYTCISILYICIYMCVHIYTYILKNITEHVRFGSNTWQRKITLKQWILMQRPKQFFKLYYVHSLRIRQNVLMGRNKQKDTQSLPQFQAISFCVQIVLHVSAFFINQSSVTGIKICEKTSTL